MRQYLIHHYEDEPEALSWLPRLLRNQCWADHPEWVRKPGDFRVEVEQDIAMRTRLWLRTSPSSEPDVEVVYCLYSSLDQFRGNCPLNGPGGDYKQSEDEILLLDLMAYNPQNGEMRKEILDPFELIRARLRPENVFFLTGWPGEIPPEVLSFLPEDHIIIKPVDPPLLVHRLLSKFGLVRRHE